MVLSSRSFGARFAHCKPGAWGKSHDACIEACERLLKCGLDDTQAHRVQARLAALRLAILTRPAAKKKTERGAEPAYVISHKAMQLQPKPSEWLIRRAFTEIHQKMAMHSKVVKQTKQMYRTKDGKFRCCRCKDVVNYLTVAHIGKPMRSRIQELDLSSNKDIGELFAALLKLHKSARFAIVCARCNASLEEA